MVKFQRYYVEQKNQTLMSKEKKSEVQGEVMLINGYRKMWKLLPLVLEKGVREY
jgi:hypothetical protein